MNKKYVWGNFDNKQFSLVEVEEKIYPNSCRQLYVRFIGTNNHLTVHELPIICRTHSYIVFMFNREKIQRFSDLNEIPMSYNWTTTNFKGTWTEQKVEIAKELGYTDPIKHGNQSQQILQKVQNIDGTYNGYNLGSCLVNLNSSNRKSRYLHKKYRLLSLEVPKNTFRLNLVLSTRYNKYRGDSKYKISTNLGRLYFILK